MASRACFAFGGEDRAPHGAVRMALDTKVPRLSLKGPVLMLGVPEPCYMPATVHTHLPPTEIVKA